MRFAIAASALFAGLAAAVPAVTITDYSTEVDTITSCASTVTDCPARTASSWFTTTTSASEAEAAVTSAAVTSVASSSSTVSESTIYIYSTDTLTITSCASTITDCPARTKVTSSVVGSTVVSVAAEDYSSAASSSEAASVYTAVASSSEAAAVYTSLSSSIIAPYPTSANGTSAYSSAATASGVSGSASSVASAYASSYTGAANHLNAGMALAGVGAFAALIL